MKKWVCPVCGYVHEGDTPPEKCPVCKVPGEKFTLQAEELSWAAEHVVGVGKVFGAEVPEEVKEEIIAGLRSNFEGECSEVGMYLAMARVAYREGYPEVGMYWEKAGLEEAERAPGRGADRQHEEESADARRCRKRRDRRQDGTGQALQKVQS